MITNNPMLQYLYYIRSGMPYMPVSMKKTSSKHKSASCSFNFLNQNINNYCFLFESFPFFPQYRPLRGDHNHSCRASLARCSCSHRHLPHPLCPCLAIRFQLISHHFKTLICQIYLKLLHLSISERLMTFAVEF